METQNIFEKFQPKDRSNLIALFQKVQEVYGYLPEKILKVLDKYEVNLG